MGLVKFREIPSFPEVASGFPESGKSFHLSFATPSNHFKRGLSVANKSNRTEITKSRAELIAEFDALTDTDRVSEIHVAAKRGCSTGLLQRERVYGSPIPFIREGGKLKADKNGLTRIFGGRVFYLKKDVLDYLESRNQTVTSTSAVSVKYRQTHPEQGVAA